MIWANLLHIYQPPTQTESILKTVSNESYRKILKGLKENPNGKITLNINASLSNLFVKYKYKDIIDDIKFLLDRGQIELTDSAAYHAFLPLLPKTEIIRQIKLNHTINKKIFGDLYDPKGFFPPELGVSSDVIKIISDLGYKWVLLDELAFPAQEGNIQYDKIYKIKDTNLIGYFREREISFKILSAQLESGNIFLSEIKDRLDKNEYMLTAMDGETFGHHRLGLELLLFDIYKSNKLKTIPYGNIDQIFTETKEVNIVPSTWALLPTELLKKQPYERWYNSENTVNVLQWELTRFAIEHVEGSKFKVRNDPLLTNEDRNKLSNSDKQWLKSRYMLDRALHSDQYWWASARPWWSIDMIERGAYELQESLLYLPGIDKKVIDKAKNLYRDIVLESFRWQREGIVDAMVEGFDEEATERIETKSLDSDPKEYDKVISHLEKQMLEAASKLEFKRASEFRKRIESLREKQQEIVEHIRLSGNKQS